MSEQTHKPGLIMKALILVALVVVVSAVMMAKGTSKGDPKKETTNPQVVSSVIGEVFNNRSDENTAKAATPDVVIQSLPKLIDLGAKKCIPCKMMAPILEELREEYKGKFDVVFIDVWENESAAEQYGIRLIPTQIFFDAKGNELFRHEGFFSKEDILGQWQKMGITFKDTPDMENANEQ